MSERVSEHIYLIDTEALGVKEMVAAYLVKGEEKKALVDTGYASSLQKLIRGLGEIGVDVTELSYIIPTHLHLDHAGASGQLAELSRRAEVLAHPRAVKHLINPTRLISSVREFYGAAADEFGEFLPIEEGRVRGVDDEGELDLGSVTLRFIHAPGHAPHQIAVFVEEDEALITGDSVSIRVPGFEANVPTTPPPSYIHDQALQTLDKLSRLGGELVLRPHFGAYPLTPSFFEEEKALLEWWRNFVADTVRNGLSFEEGVEKAKIKIAEKAGAEEIPYFLLSGINLSYLGMKNYLERKKGD